VIVTVTLNSALDRTLTVANFQSGGRNRCSDALSLPGGKGVNVARALMRLGEPVIATGLAGGRTGTAIIEQLTDEGILNDFVRIKDESRTSTAVIDPNGGQQTEINELGPEVSKAEVGILLDKIRYLSRGADFFVFAGSLPMGVEADFYADVVRELRGRGILAALDTSGPPLKAALGADPSIVSPNTREAEEIVGHEFTDDEDFAMAAQTLVEMGAETALVHDADGCVARLIPPEERTAITYHAHLAARDAVSTVGSGDALLAGYIAGLTRGDDPVACLALAVACGAANALQLGAGVFDLDDVAALRRQVRVTEVPPSDS
jgi:1-phosphofructokinase family hexose kinase